MKLRYAGMLLALCAVVLTSGCMMSERYAAYREDLDDRTFTENYADTWQDWYGDLGDIISIEGAVGEGLGVNVQATKLGNAGFMFCDVLKGGYRDRAFGFYREVRKEGGASWFYYRDLEFEPIMGTRRLFEREPVLQDFTLRHNSDRHWADVGFDTHILFLGCGFFVSPKQTLDFACSTVMLPYNLIFRGGFAILGLQLPEFDLCNDDISSRKRERHAVDLITTDEEFLPGEILDELMRLGY